MNLNGRYAVFTAEGDGFSPYIGDVIAPMSVSTAVLVITVAHYLRAHVTTLRRAIPIYSIYCVLVYTIWIQAHSRFQPGRGVSGYSFVLTNSNSHFNLVLLGLTNVRIKG